MGNFCMLQNAFGIICYIIIHNVYAISSKHISIQCDHLTQGSFGNGILAVFQRLKRYI